MNQGDTIKSNVTKNKTARDHSIDKSLVTDDKKNEDSAQTKRNEEESKLSEKKITIESRKVEVTQVISDSIET